MEALKIKMVVGWFALLDQNVDGECEENVKNSTVVTNKSTNCAG